MVHIEFTESSGNSSTLHDGRRITIRRPNRKCECATPRDAVCSAVPSFHPDPPPLSFCQAKSTKEKHVEDTGHQETGKKSSSEIAQGKESGETREEEELIRWWACSSTRGAEAAPRSGFAHSHRPIRIPKRDTPCVSQCVGGQWRLVVALDDSGW
jgi:hypothetical protein